MTQTEMTIQTVDDLTKVSEEFDTITKEVKRLEKRRTALSDSIKAALSEGLGVQSPEGNYSAHLSNGAIVMDEKRVTYNPIDNRTIPFFKSKGLGSAIVEAVDRDEMNKALKAGTFSVEEIKENFTVKETHVIKVVK